MMLFRRKPLTSSAVFSAFFHGLHAIYTNKTSCALLPTALHLKNTVIHNVTYVPANSVVSTADTCQSTALVSSTICRVYAQVNTSEYSSVKFEMWLPDTWYGRIMTIGNGGLSGCIDFDNLDYTSSLHFASISSNSGHDGDTAAPLLHHPEVLEDFSFRAVHVIAELGKKIVQQYYGQSSSKSYYSACSNGGRQGIQAALKFPSDFDGILAGSPAVDWNHLLGWLGWLGTLVGAPHGTTSSTFIPDELWPLVSAAILNQCDLQDGVADGILTEPDDCFFNTSVLLCDDHANKSLCLTQNQVTALDRIYSPLVDQETGVELFPRYDPLAENTTLREVVFGPTTFSYPLSWWQSVVYNNTHFEFDHFGIKDIEFADTINPGGIRTWNGDLQEFRKRGGKLVTFHGREDGLIASANSKRLYNLISNTLIPSNLDDFYRLFLIPGMSHCFTGPGAWMIGQSALGSRVMNDTEHNLLLALVKWVEGDVPPRSIVGTGDNGAMREHCRYPAFKSQWNGFKWECVRTR